MRMFKSAAHLVALAAFSALLAAPALAEPVVTQHVETDLHSARAAIAPGERFTIVLSQKIAEHWHTYWRNPGDSGERTQVTAWHLPDGFEAGPIQWPAPEPLPFDILVNYGYSGEVRYPITIAAPANLRVGQPVTLSADLYWLVCSDECVPESGTVSLTLDAAATGRDDPVWAPRVADALARLPQPASFQAHITAGAPARLSLAMPDAGAVRRPHFFPFDQEAIDHAAPESPSRGPGGLSFTLKAGASETLGQGPIEGVVVFDAPQGAGWVKRAYAIKATPGAPLPDTSGEALAGRIGTAPEAAPAGPQPADTSGVHGLPLALLFAFLGGLVLNIMPCVLPVLSIKALSLAGGAHSGEARRHGLIYTGGVLATFLALAALLIGLRSAGAAVGWGFQLQQPWLMAGLALLFFGIGLNLAGLFEVGGGVQDAGSGWAAKGGDAGAFFTGALAVVAATPCTAPFMAGATGFALTQSAPATLAVFAGLGLGFAAPLTALSFAPALQRLIPKPGPWMERFKNVLAFPMFGAAVWLAWVVIEQAGAPGALSLLSLAVALAFVLFTARWGRVWLAIGFIALALTGAAVWRPLAGEEPAPTLAAEAWTPAKLDTLRAEGRPVFVNFTADWCVSCKLNERVALTSARVAAAFAAHNVAYLKGDWTRPDPAIDAALEAHGRAGVPLYLYYAPGAAEPVVLPQFLSESLMLQTVGGAQR
jgi:thiol:disulfide interchange protein/DsbC/DsbD-like thiol-disulfide interchange protein